MAKHMASTTIAASPEKVWEVVSDSSQLAEWLSPLQGVDKVEPAGALAMGTKVEGTLGNIGGAKLSFKQAEPGQLLAWSAGPFMAHMMRMPMHVELALEGRGDSTTAPITFKSNPMIAPLMGMMTGLKFADEAPATMEALKAAVEKG